MWFLEKGAQGREGENGEWRKGSVGNVNHNKEKMCLGWRFYFPTFSRVAEVSLQWNQQAFAACSLLKIDPEYPGAHLQWESVSDTWQPFLEMCLVIHTAHSSYAMGIIGLKMTFSPPLNPHHQLGKLPWDTFFILSSLEASFQLYPWCLRPYMSLESDCVFRTGWLYHKHLGNPQSLVSICPSQITWHTCAWSSLCDWLLVFPFQERFIILSAII